MIFSVGHSNKPFSVLLNRLQQHQVDVLVDVRKRPYSRYCPWYNRERVIPEVEAVGIKYQFAGDILGGFEYHDTHMAAFHARIVELVELSQQKNVAMMCSEGQPYSKKHICHRWWKLSQYISVHFPEVEIQHILLDGSVEKAHKNDYQDYGIDFNGDSFNKQGVLF